jgi:hypothetical protein
MYKKMTITKTQQAFGLRSWPLHFINRSEIDSRLATKDMELWDVPSSLICLKISTYFIFHSYSNLLILPLNPLGRLSGIHLKNIQTSSKLALKDTRDYPKKTPPPALNKYIIVRTLHRQRADIQLFQKPKDARGWTPLISGPWIMDVTNIRLADPVHPRSWQDLSQATISLEWIKNKRNYSIRTERLNARARWDLGMTHRWWIADTSFRQSRRATVVRHHNIRLRWLPGMSLDNRDKTF